MHKRRIALVAAMVVVAGLAYGMVSARGQTTGSAPLKGDIAQGKRVYMGTCVMCHGTDAHGILGLGPDLVNQSEWMKQQTDQGLVQLVKEGRGPTRPDNVNGLPMLPRGGNKNLSDQDLVDVVLYLRSLQQK